VDGARTEKGPYRKRLHRSICGSALSPYYKSLISSDPDPG